MVTSFGIYQKKGVYIDGHERDDVTEYRQKYLRKMVSIGFLNKDNAPTSEAAHQLLHASQDQQHLILCIQFH